MSKHVAPRAALLVIAASAITSACSTLDTTAPKLPTVEKDVIVASGRPSAGNVEVCINPASTPGSYVVTASGTAPAPSVGTPNSPQTITLPGANCVVVFTRTNGQQPIDPQNAVTATITSYPTGATVVSSTCLIDQGTANPTDCNEPDGTAPVEAVVYVNAFHGTQVTFAFAGGLPIFSIGDTQPHSVGSPVYFWGSQWWKNNGLSLGAASGTSAFKGFSPGSATCGFDWVSPGGASSSPPATIGSVIAVIVTNRVNKVGNDLTGPVRQILYVQVDPGYGPASGQEGKGTVIGVACGSWAESPLLVTSDREWATPGNKKEARPKDGLLFLNRSIRLRSSVGARISLWQIRIVLLCLWHREVHVRTVVAAFVPCARGEHWFGRTIVELDQTPHVANAVSSW
jgi:hypothetical protein